MCRSHWAWKQAERLVIVWNSSHRGQDAQALREAEVLEIVLLPSSYIVLPNTEL